MLTVAITGASGLIGQALTAALTQRGDRAVALPRSSTYSPSQFDGVDVVVNLAGEPVDQRWTPAARGRIEASRVARTASLTEALSGAAHGVRFISASAVGIYGDRGDEVLTEDSEPGTGWLAELCQRWEAAAGPAAATLRTGIVLSGKGGALGKQLPLIRAGLGGPLGSGRQYWPWITLFDHVKAICFLIDHRKLTGPFNLAAPNPCSQLKVTTELAGLLHRPAILPAPGFALHAALGGFASEILGSQRVLPKRLTQAGFQFSHPTIDVAARWTLGSPESDLRASA